MCDVHPLHTIHILPGRGGRGRWQRVRGAPCCTQTCFPHITRIHVRVAQVDDDEDDDVEDDEDEDEGAAPSGKRKRAADDDEEEEEYEEDDE